MKKLLLVILTFTSIYFIFGCTENYQVAGPEDNSNAVSAETASAGKSIPISEIKWLSRPMNKKSLSKTLYTERMIRIGKDREKIKIDEWYPGDYFEWIWVRTKIEFDKKTIVEGYSFYDDEEYVFSDDGKKVLISLEVDDETCSVKFTPHLMFNEPAKLDFKIEGLDLRNIDTDKIEFVYIPEGSDKAFVPKYKSLKVDLKWGEVEVKDAMIPHFSRYGLLLN